MADTTILFNLPQLNFTMDRMRVRSIDLDDIDYIEIEYKGEDGQVLSVGNDVDTQEEFAALLQTCKDQLLVDDSPFFLTGRTFTNALNVVTVWGDSRSPEDVVYLEKVNAIRTKNGLDPLPLTPIPFG